jgi:hypothetical protein
MHAAWVSDGMPFDSTAPAGAGERRTRRAFSGRMGPGIEAAARGIAPAAGTAAEPPSVRDEPIIHENHLPPVDIKPP